MQCVFLNPSIHTFNNILRFYHHIEKVNSSSSERRRCCTGLIPFRIYDGRLRRRGFAELSLQFTGRIVDAGRRTVRTILFLPQCAVQSNGRRTVPAEARIVVPVEAQAVPVAVRYETVVIARRLRGIPADVSAESVRTK